MELPKSKAKHLLWISLVLFSAVRGEGEGAGSGVDVAVNANAGVNDDSKVNCPDLKCFRSGKSGESKLPPGQCYRFPDSTRQQSQVIYARECYDAEDRAARNKPTKSFCPFEAESGQYAWTDEYLQSQYGSKYFILLLFYIQESFCLL